MERDILFGFEDVWKFIWSFMIVLPLVTLIHELGHTFFILLFGGKVKLALGRGKKLFRIGLISVHRIYFLDSFIEYSNLKWSNRFTHFLVHAGGILFNFGSLFLVNYLILQGFLPIHTIFYQFAYFSVWFAVFSLLPIDYGNDEYSDGISIYFILRYGEFKQLTR